MLKGLRLIKIGDFSNNNVKVKIKEAVKSSLIFTSMTSLSNSCLNLLILKRVIRGWVTPNLSVSRSLNSFLSASHPRITRIQTPHPPPPPCAKGPNLRSIPFQEMSISRSFLCLLPLFRHVYPIGREGKTIYICLWVFFISKNKKQKNNLLD